MNEDLRLGSTEAAVRSCVNMLAALTSQREEHLAYWLDLYYQVRRAWEIEQGNEEDPKLMRAEDLAPVLREMIRAYLRSSAREEAEARTAKKKSGPMKASGPTEKPQPAEAEKEPAKNPGPWTLFKKKQFERLWNARQAGYTIAQICQASDGALSERKIMDALNSAQLSQEDWRALEKTLDAVDRMPIPAGY